MIIVSHVPKPPHSMMVHQLRVQLDAYHLANPGRIRAILRNGANSLFFAEFATAGRNKS
jgi:hypothetical protein